jgi:NADPH-dependent 2,4-dienoyl-CoA reductase/sulfur reductase-like enzyme
MPKTSQQLDRIVVIGASLAGLRAVETLRSEGYGGTITVIGAEHRRPYDRPPLSKKLLAGEWEPERISLRKPDDLDSLDVVWRLGTRAVGLDPASRDVLLDDGSAEPYDGLVIATGAAPRRVPWFDPADAPSGVFELRTLEDALALRERLGNASDDAVRLVVIGAGFIGLEVAATARQRGAQVTVLEGLPTPLVRALGPSIGSALAAVHERHGVTVRCSVVVDGLEVGADGQVTGVRLADGDVVPADVVVVGIGVAPATGWLEGVPGVELRDGIVCDATLAVGPPGVYAAGDVTRWPNGVFSVDGDAGEEMRVEHWTNAAEQGAAAARNLLAVAADGDPTPYAAVPFFWSDQFEARIQFLGRATGDDDVEIVAGSLEEGRFAAVYSRSGRLRAVLGVSMPKVVMPMRALLAQGCTRDEAVARARELAGA